MCPPAQDYDWDSNYARANDEEEALETRSIIDIGEVDEGEDIPVVLTTPWTITARVNETRRRRRVAEEEDEEQAEAMGMDIDEGGNQVENVRRTCFSS